LTAKLPSQKLQSVPQKEKAIVFQPSFFRGKLLNFRGVNMFNYFGDGNLPEGRRMTFVAPEISGIKPLRVEIQYSKGRKSLDCK